MVLQWLTIIIMKKNVKKIVEKVAQTVECLTLGSEFELFEMSRIP